MCHQPLELTKKCLSGKAYNTAYGRDNKGAIAVMQYYAGWADKISGKTIEVRFPFFQVPIKLIPPLDKREKISLHQTRAYRCCRQYCDCSLGEQI
jgi:hypothetical protein